MNITRKQIALALAAFTTFVFFVLARYFTKESPTRTISLGTTLSVSKNGPAVLNPNFNIRETLINMILLGDHLMHENKRCYDCILKHLMACEGYLMEAKSLVTEERPMLFPVDIDALAEKTRGWIQEVYTAKHKNDPNVCNDLYIRIAQEIRVERKKLLKFAAPL